MARKKKNYGQQWIPTVQQAVEDSYEKRPVGMPSLPVITQEVLKLGLTERDAEAIYTNWLTNGFKTARGHKILSWHAAIRNWYVNRYFPTQKEALRNGGPSGPDHHEKKQAAQLEKFRRAKNG